MKSGITIVEVGLRDGLQNESTKLSAAQKVELATDLVQAGVTRLELGAFVRKEKIPQMADSEQVIRESLLHLGKAQGSALVPNEKGMESALQTGIKEVAIFASCTESFSKKNINCSIEESFERFKPVIALAKKNKVKVRGYLSVCFGCPYEGKVSEAKVIELAKRMIKMGCYEISIGDTIGVANPAQVRHLFSKLKRVVPAKKLAGHFHDTRGTALTNILTAYYLGIRVFDTSLGGLGGCPYAPGSSGNVATEDVVYMFEGMKFPTGLDLKKLIEINHKVAGWMGKSLPSKVSKAGPWLA
jgi:hydroxymethylglutaryl-CoA lyase